MPGLESFPIPPSGSILLIHEYYSLGLSHFRGTEAFTVVPQLLKRLFQIFEIDSSPRQGIEPQQGSYATH